MNKVNINQIQTFKNSEKSFATLTAYDFNSAAILNEAKIPLILVGDSAGGTLAGFVANKVRNIAIRPEAQVLIYPDLAGQINKGKKRKFFDAPLLTQDDIQFYHRYASLPAKKGLHDLIRNFHHDNMPKTLVVSALIDPLAEDCQAYVKSLKRYGCDITFLEGLGLPHGFLRARHLSKKARFVFEEIIKFINQTK